MVVSGARPRWRLDRLAAGSQFSVWASTSWVDRRSGKGRRHPPGVRDGWAARQRVGARPICVVACRSDVVARASPLLPHAPPPGREHHPVITCTNASAATVPTDPISPEQVIDGQPRSGLLDLPSPAGLEVGIWEHSAVATPVLWSL